MRLTRRSVLSVGCALTGAAALVVGPAEPASAATYTFENVADSATGFDLSSFGCAAINDSGQIAFRAGRPQPGFTTTPGIYRANADGTLSVIAEKPRFDFIGFNPSINDDGVVSFAASVDGGAQDDFEAILVGAGANRVGVVADTRSQFEFFGFDTSINSSREVAFKAELADTGVEGLFSGRRGGPVTTHYLNTTSPFDGTDTRPSINDDGDIAFSETVNFNLGTFVGQDGQFRTVVRPAADTNLSEPILNNAGTVAFYRSFSEGGESVFEIDTISAGGIQTPVADTRGPLSGFGFRPPALNDKGQVAYLGILDDFVTAAVFVGPETVVSTGDTLDGATVIGLTFCEEGLNDAGQLAFVATLQDPITGDPRTAVFRATPGATFTG